MMKRNKTVKVVALLALVVLGMTMAGIAAALTFTNPIAIPTVPWTVGGTLTSSSQKMTLSEEDDEFSYRYIQAYRVTLTANTNYRISMNRVTDSDIDPYLYLTDVNGTILAYDDDDGLGLNSRLDFKPATTGTYYILASEYYRGDLGAYSLTIKYSPTGAISGKVTNEANAALAGIWVEADILTQSGSGSQAYEEFDWTGDTTTNSSGNYTLSFLDTGIYYVRFDDEDGVYAEQWYNQTDNEDLARDIYVTDGQTVPNINGKLQRAASLSGKVTDTDNVGLSGIEVTVYRYYEDEEEEGWWEDSRSTDTQSDGTWTVSGLRAGSYKVGFNDWEYGEYATQYYNNKTNLGSADEIALITFQQRAGINARLTTDNPRGSISGRVTDATTGAGIANVSVAVYTLVDSEWNWHDGGTSTDANGNYRIRGLSDDEYMVGFYDYDGGHIRTFYDNSILISSANRVSNINVQMHQGASISGQVKNSSNQALEDVEVVAYRQVWSEDASPTGGSGYYYYDWVDSSYTGEAGNYQFKGLEAGIYRVAFNGGSNYLYQIYNGKNATTFYSSIYDFLGNSLGNDIVVTAASTKSNINAILTSAGKISGTLTDTSGRPIANARVEVSDRDSWDWYSTTTYTEEDGRYTVGSLPTGTYYMKFSAPGYITKYWNNVTNPVSASAISVTVGQTRTCNVQLEINPNAATISGTVSRESGSPARWSEIELRRYYEDGGYWNSEQWISAGDDGGYIIRGLKAGVKYRLHFYNWDYGEIYWQNASSFEDATDITLTTGETRTINATIPNLWGEFEPNYIAYSGTVRDGDTHAPLRNIEVGAYYYDEEEDSWYSTDWTYTDVSGQFSFSLPEDTHGYKFGFFDENETYRTQYWQNETNLDDASTVPAELGTSVPTLDVSLTRMPAPQYGSVSGRITNSSGVGIASIRVG
ncbi:MAG: carboxypeptidase regulatory-like domain-containing protein, partial [Actinomycetes bacterium]|nr:carboxypeptidase regulatory-like domain-containing protein [Actinomycetes bacterium]